MDLSQILGILNGMNMGGNGVNQNQTAENQGLNSQGGENTSSQNQNSTNFSGFGGNNQLLNLLLPLLLSGNLGQDAIFETLSKSNPLFGSIASVMSNSKKKTNEKFQRKSNIQYVKVDDYWAKH